MIKLYGIRRFIQWNTFGCGAECVRSVLDYYGMNHMSKSELYEELGTTPDEGTDEKKIKRFLQSYGLRTRQMYFGTFRKLRRAIDYGYPVILWIKKEDHWVVLKGYSDDAVYVMDPSAFSVPRREWSTFKRKWRGYGIIVMEG